MPRYTQARRDADHAYQKKIHKMTVIFPPEDESLWEAVHKVADDYGGTSPLMRKLLREFVHGLSTEFETSSNVHKCPDA